MEFLNKFKLIIMNTIFVPTRGVGGGGIVQPPPPHMTTTDLEALDDDDDDDEVVILSPRSFAQAMIRNREVTTIIAERPNDSRSDEASTSTIRYNMRKRPATSGGRSNSKKKCVTMSVVTPQAAPPKPPPKEPAFSCPVCMSSLVEATSTKCGHIFCKQCINSALSAQSKCPTCRKKLSVKDTIRVYLPATEMS